MENETETLRYMAGANTNRQVAKVLDAAAQTMTNHITRILATLDADTGARSVVLAMQ